MRDGLRSGRGWIRGQQTEAKWKERFCENCLLSAPGPSGRGAALERVGKGRCRQRQHRGVADPADPGGRNSPMIAIKRAYEPARCDDGTDPGRSALAARR